MVAAGVEPAQHLSEPRRSELEAEQASTRPRHRRSTVARRAPDRSTTRDDSTRPAATTTPTRDSTRTSVPWGGDHAVGWQQAPDAAADAAHDDPRDAAAVRAAGPDAGACGTARRSQLAGPRLARAPHARATRSTTSASTTPRTACCSRATTCCPSITPHVVGRRARATRCKSYLATLDLVARARRRAARAARARPSVRRRARPRRGDQGAPRRAHGEAARRRRSRSVPPTCVELSHEVFPERHWGVMAESETFAHLEHLRRSTATPSAGTSDGVLMYRVAAAC